MSDHSDLYQVVIVKYGTRDAMRSDVYLNYDLYHQTDSSIKMDYFFWIIRNEHRVVVVDTGFSRYGGETRGRTLLGDVLQMFASEGVRPADAPDVILTHAHYDHAGNLDSFPTSRVIMAQKEYDFWSGRHAQRTLFHHSIDDDNLAHLSEVAQQGRLHLIRDDFALAPGIDIKVVGGHTPGQCVVKVKTSEGVVLLASDAIHYYEEFDADMVFTSVSDLVEMYEGFDSVRSMLQSGEIDHLVSGHDPDTIRRFSPQGVADGVLVATIGTFDTHVARTVS